VLHIEESVASDQRLVDMTALYARFASWSQEHIDGREAVDIANQIWRLGEEEGYCSERGRLAADVTHVTAAHSE
jgi:hypothetical protein